MKKLITIIYFLLAFIAGKAQEANLIINGNGEYWLNGDSEQPGAWVQPSQSSYHGATDLSVEFCSQEWCDNKGIILESNKQLKHGMRLFVMVKMYGAEYNDITFTLETFIGGEVIGTGMGVNGVVSFVVGSVPANTTKLVFKGQISNATSFDWVNLTVEKIVLVDATGSNWTDPIVESCGSVVLQAPGNLALNSYNWTYTKGLLLAPDVLVVFAQDQAVSVTVTETATGNVANYGTNVVIHEYPELDLIPEQGLQGALYDTIQPIIVSEYNNFIYRYPENWDLQTVNEYVVPRWGQRFLHILRSDAGCEAGKAIWMQPIDSSDWDMMYPCSEIWVSFQNFGIIPDDNYYAPLHWRTVDGGYYESSADSLLLTENIVWFYMKGLVPAAKPGTFTVKTVNRNIVWSEVAFDVTQDQQCGITTASIILQGDSVCNCDCDDIDSQKDPELWALWGCDNVVWNSLPHTTEWRDNFGNVISLSDKFTTTQNKTVTVTVTNEHGCAKNETVEIVVPTADFEDVVITPVAQNCASTTFEIQPMDFVVAAWLQDTGNNQWQLQIDNGAIVAGEGLISITQANACGNHVTYLQNDKISYLDTVVVPAYDTIATCTLQISFSQALYSNVEVNGVGGQFTPVLEPGNHTVVLYDECGVSRRLNFTIPSMIIPNISVQTTETEVTFSVSGSYFKPGSVEYSYLQGMGWYAGSEVTLPKWENMTTEVSFKGILQNGCFYERDIQFALDTDTLTEIKIDTVTVFKTDTLTITETDTVSVERYFIASSVVQDSTVTLSLENYWEFVSDGWTWSSSELFANSAEVSVSFTIPNDGVVYQVTLRNNTYAWMVKSWNFYYNQEIGQVEMKELQVNHSVQGNQENFVLTNWQQLQEAGFETPQWQITDATGQTTVTLENLSLTLPEIGSLKVELTTKNPTAQYELKESWWFERTVRTDTVVETNVVYLTDTVFVEKTVFKTDTIYVASESQLPIINPNEGLVYPNPTYGEIFAKVKDMGMVEIYDVKGSLVASYDATAAMNEKVFDISSFTNGTYYIRIYNFYYGNSRVWKLVKM